MTRQPKHSGADRWIDAGLSPPRGFIAASVHLAMVSPTQRNGEFIAGLTPKRTGLCEPQMVGIRRLPTANQAGLLGNRSDVVPVTNPTRLR